MRIAVAALAALLAGAAAAADDPRADFRAVRAIERTGPRQATFDIPLDRLIARLPPTADPLGRDARKLGGAVRAIAARAPAPLAPGARLAGRVRLPAGAFSTFRDRLADTFAGRMGLTRATAEALADEIEAQALAVAGIDEAAYAAATGARRTAPAERRAAAAAALEAMWRGSRVDHGFEVPYVAGYDRDQADYVFIDCSIPLLAERGGAALPVGALLTLHERVEKAILADHATSYPHAHQIALRVERAAAEATGVPWAPYDALITEVSEAIAARRAPKISDRLDLQPYLTFSDAQNRRLVAAMRRDMIAHARRARPAAGPDLPVAPACPPGGLQGSSTLSQ